MDQRSNVHLKWNKHQATLVSVFDALLDNENLTDCTVSAEGQHIRAHKIILSACSPYFEELFTKNYETHPILILHDVKYDVVKALVDFMYRGEINVPQKELSGVLKLSESLQIKGLSGSGCIDDADIEEGSGGNAPTVSPEALQSESASVQRFTSDQDEPEEKVQSFGGCSLTVSSQEEKCVEGDSVPKYIPKYSKSISHSGSGRRTGRKAFRKVVTPNLPSRRQAVSTLSNPTGAPSVSESRTSQSECSQLQISCGELTFHPIVTEKNRFPSPETALASQKSPNMNAHGELIPLKIKPEFVDSHIDIVDIDDDDNDYHDIYANTEDNIEESGRVNEGLTCEANFLTVGINSQQSPLSSENLNNVMTTSPTVSNFRFVCQSCGKSYRYPQGLQRHVKHYCGKEPQFQCPRCKKLCWRNDELRAHMATNRCQMHDMYSTLVDSVNVTQQWS